LHSIAARRPSHSHLGFVSMSVVVPRDVRVPAVRTLQVEESFRWHPRKTRLFPATSDPEISRKSPFAAQDSRLTPPGVKEQMNYPAALASFFARTHARIRGKNPAISITSGKLPRLDQRAPPRVQGRTQPSRSSDRAHALLTALPSSSVPSRNRDRAPARARIARPARPNSDASAPFQVQRA